MKALSLRWPAGSAADPHVTVRAVRLYESPPLAGLLSRRLCAANGSLRGEYLFENDDSLRRFIRDPAADPACDLAARATGSAPSVVSIDEAPLPEAVERPIFVVAAPRAGGTLLLDLLASSSQFWTLEIGRAHV